MSTERPWSGTGMAYNWGRAMRRITDHAPMVGAVAWWDAGDGVGSSGHVAYVEQVVSPTRSSSPRTAGAATSTGASITQATAAAGRPASSTSTTKAVQNTDAPRDHRHAAVGVAAPAAARHLDARPGTDVARQWLADGRAIAGRHRPDLHADRRRAAARRSRSRSTATARGYPPATVDDRADRARSRAATFTVVAPPTLTGDAAVDEVLTVDAGDLVAGPEDTARPWYADGELIEGATGRP